jgi:hypothetical protein
MPTSASSAATQLLFRVRFQQQSEGIGGGRNNGLYVFRFELLNLRWQIAELLPGRTNALSAHESENR